MLHNYVQKGLLVVLIVVFSDTLLAQVSVSNDGSAPHSSAMLEVKSTLSGLLPPRMTQAQRNAIVSPAEGLMVICTDCGVIHPSSLSIFIDGAWRLLNGYCNPPDTPLEATHFATSDSITWNWNPVANAVAYRWNTNNSLQDATYLVNSTTISEPGLTCDSTYIRYVWAYNDCGYSNPVILNQSTQPCPFSCGKSFTDPRDGKVYSTVQIGTQCWFSQNLNVGTLIDVLSNQTNNSIPEKYCYGNAEANCTIYGGLYQWDEVMNYTSPSDSNPSHRQGICPAGWHLPSNAEWDQLVTFLGGETLAGGAMKEPGTTHWASPNGGATNSSGFTALGGGLMGTGGSQYSFYYLFQNAYFWTSTLVNESSYLSRSLDKNNGHIFFGYGPAINGYSARCVKD